MKQEQTRTLQIFIFLVGFAWALFALFSGRFTRPDVYIALIVEFILLYSLLIKRKLKEMELFVFLSLSVIYFVIMTLIYIFTGYFSEMVPMALSAVIIYVVLTERRWLRKIRPSTDSTKIILAGIYSAGIFYILLVMYHGAWIYPGVSLALIIEAFLLYSALIRPPPDKMELTIITLMAILALIVGTIPVLHHVVIMAVAGLLIYGIVLSEPKFPLTKRALSTGIVVGIIIKKVHGNTAGAGHKSEKTVFIKARVTIFQNV